MSQVLLVFLLCKSWHTGLCPHDLLLLLLLLVVICLQHFQALYSHKDTSSGGRGEKFLPILTARETFLESLLKSHWPELCHKLISELIADKRVIVSPWLTQTDQHFLPCFGEGPSFSWSRWLTGKKSKYEGVNIREQQTVLTFTLNFLMKIR